MLHGGYKKSAIGKATSFSVNGKKSGDLQKG
jgi:hypothetical protein